MAAKISTIVLKVDLDCKSCYKKISKTISQLQEKENIETVVYDEKNNTVTISGPFDAKRICKKLCCKACKVIKDIQIKDNKEKEKPKEDKPKEKEKLKEDKPKEKEDKPKENEKPKEDKPKENEKPKEDKPKEKEKLIEDKPKEKEMLKEDKPKEKEKPCWPGTVCVCGCKPWYGGYYGNNRCPWCWRGFDCEWVAPPQVVVQPPVVVYGAPPDYYGHKSCEFFYEEEPQAGCSIM